MPLSSAGHDEQRVVDATPSRIIVARVGATVDTVIAWLKIWVIDVASQRDGTGLLPRERDWRHRIVPKGFVSKRELNPAARDL